MRGYLPALGYAYVGLALVAFGIARDHLPAAESFFVVAGFAYLWFLGSLRARLVRYDPDGFFAAVVVLGGAAYLPLQAGGLVQRDVPPPPPAGGGARPAGRRPRRARLAGRRIGRRRLLARGAPRAEGPALVRPVRG